jgi:hypothetical protein
VPMKNGATANHSDFLSLHDHLLKECVAMAKYALASGLKVPPGLMQTLEDLANHKGVNSAEPPGAGADVPTSDEMSTKNGAATHNNGNDTVRTLTQIHTRLAEILAPATPRTILLLENESSAKTLWGFRGAVGLIRRMMALSIAFLIAFLIMVIGLGASPLVNADTIREGIFGHDGMELVLNLLFLLAATGLGACFAGLFQANQYIANSTFDPKFESSYWIRVVLGLMAGVILSELIPLDIFGNGETEGSPAANSAEALGKPILALLGGFSAAAVYRIIARIIDSLESLVRGNSKEAMAAQEQAARAQFQSRLMQNRINLASNLTRLQQKLDSGAAPEELKQELDQVLNDLIPAGSFEGQRG